jgi:murein DD-endopeptidase MepM/ murein hydrolase activator NlpD
VTLWISALSLLVLAALAPAVAAAGTGGAVAGIRPSAAAFSVASTTVVPGAAITFAFRATPGLQARVDLLAPGRSAVRARLGRVPATGAVRIAWTPPAGALPAGRYTARLVITSRGTHAYLRSPLAVAAPIAATAKQAVTAPTAGIFPVQGPYSFGGADMRFGASRDGHIHEGQDIAAAEGTPVVSPLAGTVHTVAYQAAAAGYYIVVNAADGRDLVFMHLEAASTIVTTGQAVTAGQRLASVGATGDAAGPHLHFEIWSDGWYASHASKPVDPLPQLQAWAG